jgi:hypothetical protein
MNMKLRQAAHTIVSVPFQIMLLILSFLLFIGFLYNPIVDFEPVNSQPAIFEAPGQTAGAKPAMHIKTGLIITDFLKFDVIKNEFEANAIIWFIFNSQQLSQETIEKFSFTKGDITYKSDAVVTQIDAQTKKLLYFIRVRFSTIPNYRRFPLDDHYLFLNLINTQMLSDQIMFDVDEYTLSPNLYAAGWKIVEHEARAGFGKTEIGENQVIVQPKVSFSMGLAKRDFRQLLIIMLPLLLIFYCGIFALSLKNLPESIALILASITGLTAYSFVIQTLSPSVGYLMLCDYMFLLFLAATFVIFFLIILDAAPEHVFSKKTLEITKALAIIIIYVLILAAWYYLTNIKDVH